MLDKLGSTSLVNSKCHLGFLSLVNNINDFVENFEFRDSGGSICEQKKIQEFSYLFVARLFSRGKSSFAICGEQMQIYLTQLDMTEIQSGIVDLSHPSLSNSNANDESIQRLIQSNDTALIYLQSPFNEDFQSKDFTEKLSSLNEKLSKLNEELHSRIILDFLNQHKKHVDAVILFCQLLNLICLSQSLYAFAYQIKANKNFARMIELLLRVNPIELQNYEHVERLAKRFYLIFVGNLTARVFSHQTLEIVEMALSSGVKR